MRKKLFIFSLAVCFIFLLFLPLLVFSRSVAITSSTVTLQATEAGVDLTTAGHFFVQVDQDDWEKNGKTMYPDKTDRSAAVITAQAEFLTQADIYIKQCIESGFYTQQSEGAGLDLASQTAIDYSVICMDGDIGCELYVRQNNQQYILNLYPTLSDESTAATAARVAMIVERDIIVSASDAGSFWK